MQKTSTPHMSDVLKFLYKHDQDELAQIILNELTAKPFHVCPTPVCNRPHVIGNMPLVKPGSFGPYMTYGAGGAVNV